MSPPVQSEPFDPLRKGLYTPDELMEGYSSRDPGASLDQRIARYFLAAGGRSPFSAAEAIAQRLHDYGIDEALRELLAGGGVPPRVIGIMGSHSTRRDDPLYAQVAEIAWRLARAGFLVATGGGPGMMEAANLGAYLAHSRRRAVLHEAIRTLIAAPVAAVDNARYVNAARRVLRLHPKGTDSLGVPTWVYPAEPINLFARHIAKYFSNSLREDGLIALGSHGVVLVGDTPGTVREAFQTAEQNSYWVGDRRSPIAFFGERAASSYELLRTYAKRDGYADLLMLTDDPAKVIDFITRTPPRMRTSVTSDRKGRRARPRRILARR